LTLRTTGGGPGGQLRLSTILAFVLGIALCLGCDGTPEGRLELTYSLGSSEGAPLGCAVLGATSVEISLFHLPDDALAYHRVLLPCSVSAEGLGKSELRVDAHRYSRLEARLTSSVGTTVRMCCSGQNVEARHTEAPVDVFAGRKVSLHWRIEGEPGSCPASP
jgi:hypothetical protein